MIKIILYIIAPKQWLDSDAIDASCLSRFKSSECDASVCYKGAQLSAYCNTHLYLYDTMDGFDFESHLVDERNDFIDLSRLDEYETLFLPLHLIGHWILCVCHVKTKIIEFYDSLFAPERTGLAYVYVIPFLNTLFKFDGESVRWEVKNFGLASPQQPNGYDCGIYVIHTVWCILRGIQVCAPPSNFRETCLSWILD